MPNFLGDERHFAAAFGRRILAAKDDRCSAAELQDSSTPSFDLFLLCF
jgi:hypothetical protein